jgi:hypothetical protein
LSLKLFIVSLIIILTLGGFVSTQTSTCQLFDRGGVGGGHVEFGGNADRGSTGGESSASSTAGLDISYR